MVDGASIPITAGFGVLTMSGDRRGFAGVGLQATAAGRRCLRARASRPTADGPSMVLRLALVLGLAWHHIASLFVISTTSATRIRLITSSMAMMPTTFSMVLR